MEDDEYLLTQEWSNEIYKAADRMDKIEAAERLVGDMSHHPFHGIDVPF